MASIFLSYSREDAAKAKALAKCLERGGHKVWWDRHIQGGSEYAGEIEAALGAAEVIIVLWSEAASHSAWVRDEAAEGRDSGRLIPLLLDQSPPPLGFRQLQSISIAGWSGRGNPPDYPALKAAIERISGQPHGDAGPKREQVVNPRRRMVLAGLSALALLVVAAVGFFLLKGGAAKAEPTIAVLPFADLSPGRDKAFLAEGVAEAILTVLAKEPGIKVIGRSSAGQLHAAGGAAADMRKAMGITHVLEGSARSMGDQLRMSVRLIDAEDGSQVWAEEYNRKLDNIFAVQDEIGRSVATRLRGSIGRSPTATAQVTNVDAYTLYLAARAKMRDRKTSSLQEALQLAKKMVAADPKYAPGQALMAELIWHLSEQSYGSFPHERAVARAKAHAMRAVQLAPDAAEGHAALGLILSDPAENESALESLTKAIRLDPARAELRHWLASHLDALGRHEEALEQFRAVVETDPLWGTGVSQYAYTLAASERYAEAETVVASFEQRGGSPGVAARIRGDIANYRGDYSEAIRLVHLAVKKDPETPLSGRSLSWFYWLVGLPHLLTQEPAGMPLLARLYFSGDDRRMAEEIDKAGPQLWKQGGSGLAVEWLGYRRDWRRVESLYDRHPEGRSAFCGADPQFFTALVVVKSLELGGRRDESRRILSCVKRALQRESRSSVRSAYWPGAFLDLLWSQVHAFENRPEQAFAQLERGIARGVRTPYGRGLAEFPILDPYRDLAAYRRLDGRLKQLIAADRAEVLQMLEKERRSVRQAA